ncbi:hypothetical protein Lnau_0613 [Legionella nautarum]|uniref:Uncharacterized protein n=1 Tax=Legionella nautarum TaxID=45070 RepID=A0A0W0WZF9_9GAMM|nr:hypothetical protein [Legionella nautarum]KTD37682.1 hypothetical protein Lnau_0613 [Legionella nautarum]
MINELIKDLHNNLVGIPYLLNEGKFVEAEKELAVAAKNLQELMDYSLFLPAYEEKAQSFLENFVELSMRMAFLSTDRLIGAYDEAVACNDTIKAANLLQQIKNKLTFMREAYADALKDGRGQTAAFIDFSTDFPRLLACLKKSEEKAVVQHMCNNFENAMNFQYGQHQFFSLTRSSEEFQANLIPMRSDSEFEP